MDVKKYILVSNYFFYFYIAENVVRDIERTTCVVSTMVVNKSKLACRIDIPWTLFFIFRNSLTQSSNSMTVGVPCNLLSILSNMSLFYKYVVAITLDTLPVNIAICHFNEWQRAWCSG